MGKPIVAIVGKPNVGKSTFFNYIIGQRISIVEDTPGVTRDRVYAEANWRGVDFTLIDTAGIEPESDDIIISQMREQANIAINIADVIIARSGISTGKVGDLTIVEDTYKSVDVSWTADDGNYAAINTKATVSNIELGNALISMLSTAKAA